MTKVLSGKVVRDKIAQTLKSQIQNLKTKPHLVIIQVGNLPESNTYIKQKVLFGQNIGAKVEHVKLEEDIFEKDLILKIKKYNLDTSVHGIIVQMPIPKNLDKEKIINAISFQKDVDGQTAVNMKKLIENDPTGFLPATTKGILTLLEHCGVNAEGKNVVVVGRSTLVGKPTALALLNQNATVTLAHSKTKNLRNITKSADILIVAAGKQNLIGKEHVSQNQTIIDVGINVINSNDKPEDEPAGKKLVGDVNFEEVSKIVEAISPVPGGVGPMTVASLFQNLLKASKR